MSSRDFFARLLTYCNKALCSGEADSPFLIVSFSLNVSADVAIRFLYVFATGTNVVSILLPTAFLTEKHHWMLRRTNGAFLHAGESLSDRWSCWHVLFFFAN